MGTFAEQRSSIIVYHLPTKDRKLLVSFPSSGNKQKLPFFVSFVFRVSVCVCVCMSVCVLYILYIFFLNFYLYAAVSNGKWKHRQFSVIRLPFAHRANGSLSFVRLSTNKQMKVIHLQTD
jgi:hypothetical protein